MGRYLVKCDLCKKTIKTTDNIQESYQGGYCDKCKYAGTQKKSLYGAIQSRDKKLISEIEKKANAGQIVRIM